MTSVDTTMTVVSGSNLMGGKTPSGTETYTVVIDPDTALEEIVDVITYTSGNSLILETTGGRNKDGSSAVAHSAGAVVRHMVIGRDLQESNNHIEASTFYNNGTNDTAKSLHGLGSSDGSVVGTTKSQTLTNKTLTAPVIAVISNTGALTLPTSTDTLVGKATTDTLTNKTFDTAGTGNVLRINGTTISGTSGTGSVVLAVSPTVTGTALATNLTASGTVTAAAFSGPLTGNVTGNLTGNVTGNVTGSSGSTTGNAATATALATGRTIALTGDVTGTSGSFDGTGNASITAAIAANSIVDADINASAAIDWTKIAPSATVSTTELGYLDGVTSAIQTQIDAKLATATAASTYAPLASAALTGVPTAPTAAADTNTTQIATTAYVQGELTQLINSAPGTLDTLKELADALGNDTAFSTTVTNSIATKLPLAGGTMSGAIAMGTNKITGVGNPTNAQDVATKDYIDNTVLAPSNLTGPITSVGAATSVASQTGTGSKFVMDTSPTLVTPVLGVATATSINGTTIPSSKTLVATDSTAYVVPSQTSNSGKYLTTDGTTSSWGTVASYSAPTIGSTSIPSGTTVTTIAGLTLTSPVINSPKISSTYTTKTAAYTFASGDEGNIFSMNNAATQQFNIPTDATFNFAVGTEINVFWITGAGQPTIGAVTPGTTTVISTGSTSVTPKLRVANSAATCKKIAANTWLVVGDIS